MTFESSVHGFHLYFSRWPKEPGNRGSRDKTLPDWSGRSVRIEVVSVMDRELAESLWGLLETPHARAYSKKSA